MKTTYQQISRSVVFLFCCLAASWAQAATVFNISFFDNNNVQVGQGQFSVDLGVSLAYQYFSSRNPDPDEEPLFITVHDPMTDFSANIQGTSWDYEDFEFVNNAYWGGGVQSLNFFATFAPIPVSEWFFRGSDNLTMDGVGNAVSGSGRWLKGGPEVSIIPTISDENRSGTWTATATPIPAAAWLFASGLGALGVFRRKKS